MVTRQRIQVLAAFAAFALAVGVIPLLARAQAKVVNVYSARHYDTDDRLYSDFTAQTGIQVNLIEGTDDQIIERVKSEGANSPADVLVTVDAGRLWRAEQAGLFSCIQSDVLNARIPESMRHPDGCWVGLAKRARVIMYSIDRVDPSELSTYEDLADPKWKGRIVVRSSSHVYNQSLVGSMLETYGPAATEQWARGLVSNFARAPQGGDADQLKAVSAGLADLALVNTYYLARMATSTDPLDQETFQKVRPFFPNQNDRGTHINVSGAGVIRTAPNAANALAFIEYLTSPSAQELFALGSNEYPAVPGAQPNPVLAAWGDFRGDELNASVYGRNNPQALMIMDRAGWR
ncbi:MAG: Fe(3+) ABC transporter substrate-binding protein [Chloroflexota bacterium]